MNWNLVVRQLAIASVKPSSLGTGSSWRPVVLPSVEASRRGAVRAARIVASRQAWVATVNDRPPGQAALDAWWTLTLEKFAGWRPSRGRARSEWSIARHDKTGRVLRYVAARLAAEDLGLIPTTNIGENP